MGLEAYRKKRNFDQTSEPQGKAVNATANHGIFVIHKHDATRLHYDLRLEYHGILWSWAVTRGPSLDPAEKRLAVHVEDHPLEYADFEGVIPKGSYGAGSVIVWDRGSWVPNGDALAGLNKGHLAFSLEGQKLKGEWHLVRLKPRANEKRDNWLLIKVEDRFAKHDHDILESHPNSVISSQTIEDLNQPHRRKTIGKSTAKTSKTAKNHSSFISPALATLKAEPPKGSEWLHEVKFDGYRIQAHISKNHVSLMTRSGLDWTPRFGEAIQRELLDLRSIDAVIDGEIIVQGPNGGSSFALLQDDLSAGRTDRMVFYAFDLLHLDGQSYLSRSLMDRKHRLEILLGDRAPDAAIRFSEDFNATGEVLLAHSCRMGLEGIISKRRDAPYRSGRSFDWIKSKCIQRQEFIIIGYLASEATGRGLRSFLVAYHDQGELKFGGRVGTGFTGKTGHDLLTKLKAMTQRDPAIAKLKRVEKTAIWVKPEIVVEVEFRTWTAAGILRQASFKGMREDKALEDVVKEVPVSESTMAKKNSETSKPKTSVELSHPDKILWPQAGISKQDALDYYQLVWPRMERFVVNRPLSLVRAPDGVGGQTFFQKHASPGMHPKVAAIKDTADGQELLFIRDFDGLAGLIQLGVVEIHIWGAKIDEIELPDQIIFDLDPDESLAVEAVQSAATDLRTHIEALGFNAFLKTSGGKGFHIVVPIKPKADWNTVRKFAHDFADAIVQSSPENYTSTLSKKARVGKIFIDYLRNGKGSTTVAPYSLRAKDTASISMPIDWSLLNEHIKPDAFQVKDGSLAKILKQADPWVGFFKSPKPLKR